MDNRNSKSDEEWVEDRLASLTPPAGWRPNTDRALESLLQQRSSSTSRAIRFSMAGVTLAVVVVVLMLLPWNVLWTPKGNEQIAPHQQVTPQRVDPGLPVTGPIQESAATGQKDPLPEGPQRQDAEPAKAEPAKTEPSPSQSPTSVEPSPVKRKKEPRVFAANPEVPREVLVAAASAQAQGQQPAPPSDVSQPVVIRKVNPAYTEEAKQARITGTVELFCLVAVDGTVKVDSVRKSLGYGLDESATAAVEQWEFVPARKDGKPVATYTTIVINFGLK